MAEPSRDRWGRYKLPDPDTGAERPWTRATTLAKAVEDMTNIHAWEMRNVMYGLMLEDSEDLRALAMATDLDEKKQWANIAEQAKGRARSGARSNIGTALHKFTERKDQGQPVRGTPTLERDVDAYYAKLRELKVKVEGRYIERITVVPEISVAGTMDRIVHYLVDGKSYIGDLKTGSSVDFAMSFAIQLAIYAHGRGLWNAFDGVYDPMPEVDQDRAVIIHLPAGEAKPALYWVDIKTGWDMAQTCYKVREWRKRRDWLTPFEEVSGGVL